MARLLRIGKRSEPLPWQRFAIKCAGKSEKCAARTDTLKHDAKAASSNGVDLDLGNDENARHSWQSFSHLGQPQTACSSKADDNVVRLARNIDDVLGDTNTLSYFIQYMHSIGTRA